MRRNDVTLQRVLNYIARSGDVEQLDRICNAAYSRRREVVEQKRVEQQRAKLDELGAAAAIVRDPAIEVIHFGSRGALYQAARWYVRKRHNGRKHVGLFLTRTPDERLCRRSAVWLGLEDAGNWIPEMRS